MIRQLTWRVRMTVQSDRTLGQLRSIIESWLSDIDEILSVKAELTGSVLLPED